MSRPNVEAAPATAGDIEMDAKYLNETQHIEVPGLSKADIDTGMKFSVVQDNADQGDSFENSLSIRRAIRMYRKAIFWALVASLSIVMEGYDLALVGTYTALPIFRQFFGTYYEGINQYQIPSQWQSALGTAGLIGNYIGIPFGSWLIDRWGYRKALLLNYVLILPFIAVQAFAQNLGMLFAGGLLVGIPFGVFSTLACGYASELCPTVLRGYMTGWINFCWVIGLLFGQGISNAILNYENTWGFRIGYMTQWVWPLVLIFTMFMAPESPWWFIKNNRTSDAELALKRLTEPAMHEHVPSLVQSMVRTYQLEIDIGGQPSWFDCFRGADRRRTEIACFAFMCQSLCGDPLCGNVVYFLQSSGVPTSWSFRIGLINKAVIFFGCCGGYAAMTFFGRRTMYCWGMGVMCLGLIVIGGVQKAADTINRDAQWGMAVIVICWNVWRVICIGPLCYTVVAEVSSLRLRNKTIGLARISYQIVGLCVQFFQPWLINPASLNLKGYAAWVWAPICFVGFVWAFLRLPEMKGRSYYELDVLFERGVPARKFATTQVEAFADDKLREDRNIDQHL